MVAMAVVAEVEAALRQGEVALIGDIVAAVTDEYAIVRTRLLQIATKVAPQLAVVTPHLKRRERSSMPRLRMRLKTCRRTRRRYGR